MKARKYTNVRISKDVYCNSLGQYNFLVFCQDTKRSYRLEYSPGFYLTCWSRSENSKPLSIEFPRYLYDEVERLIIDAYRKYELSVYEKDMDGNKRRGDYRYHSDELLALNMEALISK